MNVLNAVRIQRTHKNDIFGICAHRNNITINNETK